MILHKRGGLASIILIVAMLFMIFVGWFVSTQLYVQMEDKVSPQIDNNTRSRLLPYITNMQNSWPLLLIAGVLLLGVLYVMRKDPNETIIY